MNIQYPRHMHSPSWDQSNNNNNNNGRKKDTQIANSLPNNQPTDSFFNRVFGHHSSESSRGKECYLCFIFLSPFFNTFFFLFFFSFSFSLFYSWIACSATITSPTFETRIITKILLASFSQFIYWNSTHFYCNTLSNISRYRNSNGRS